jgi:hypothetical protein
MKLTRLLSASILALLLGMTTMVYAQEQHEDSKPQDDTKEAPRQDEAKPQKPDQDKDKPAQSNDKMQNDKAQNNNDKMAKQDNATAKKEGSQAGRIPEDKFRASFGRQHTFSVTHVTTVGGRPQFQYGGYSFVVVDAWPVGWAYTDQCYIDYIDGEYFLFDLLHPGVQVAITVVL